MLMPHANDRHAHLIASGQLPQKYYDYTLWLFIPILVFLC